MGAFDGESEAVRQSRAKATLRLNLAVSGGSTPVYWKHDGKRFAGKPSGNTKPNDWLTRCSGSTLKLCAGVLYDLSLTSNRPAHFRESTGRWRVIEVDDAGRQVDLPLLLIDPPGAAATAVPSIAAQPQPAASTLFLQSSASTQPPLPLSGSALASTAQLMAQMPNSSTPLCSEPTATTFPSLSSTPTIDGAPSQFSGPAFGSHAHFSGPQLQVQGSSQTVGTVVAANVDPLSLRWTDVTPEDCRDSRSTYGAALRCRLPPSSPGRRQYLLLEVFVEDFGHLVCPIQIKVYSPTDRGALSSFRLRHIQFDFREDSSGEGDLYAINYYQL